MTIVMGLNQHRAQVTAEWLDTETGEVSRARVTPADRAGIRRFLARFAGQRLEVALEATTGWRFVVEEVRAIGAEPHLAEPAEASALKGSKKRAKTDRGDARHLRELLMTGRLPESKMRSMRASDGQVKMGSGGAAGPVVFFVCLMESNNAFCSTCGSTHVHQLAYRLNVGVVVGGFVGTSASPGFASYRSATTPRPGGNT